MLIRLAMAKDSRASRTRSAIPADLHHSTRIFFTHSIKIP